MYLQIFMQRVKICPSSLQIQNKNKPNIPLYCVLPPMCPGFDSRTQCLFDAPWVNKNYLLYFTSLLVMMDIPDSLRIKRSKPKHCLLTDRLRTFPVHSTQAITPKPTLRLIVRLAYSGCTSGARNSLKTRQC